MGLWHTIVATCKGIRCPGNFCPWNPESWALESGIQLNEIRNPTSDWNPEAVILVCLNTIVMQMRLVALQTLLNFGMMKVNSGHHSGHPNRNIRYYDSEGNDDDIGEGGEPILGELSYPNKSSAVLRVKSVQCSA